MNILEKQLSLQLNASWQVIGVRNIRDTIVSMCSLTNESHPCLALNMETAVDENGEVTLINAIPTKWEDWILLPVRENDLFITASHGRKIRAPLVTIAVNFTKVPMHRPRFSTGNVHIRDDFTCAYTGEKLTRSTATIDHIQPRSRGGKDEWLNVVSCHRRINALKADRTPEEAGLKLLRKPIAPPAIPVSAAIKEAKVAEWIPFLVK